MADYQRLITTEDIQRRYNLQSLESERKIIHTLNDNLTKTFGIIKNYITCMTSLGSKEQYFLSGVPTLENYPYTEWEDPEDHINTVYYDTDGGKVYIFKYNSDDDYYYWDESMDSSLLNAMSVANSQADVSEDNLRRVFYEQPTVPYNVGDIWINGSKIYRCMRNETAESEFYQDDWIDYLQYNDSVATSNALRILGEFKETVETEYVTKTLLETTADTITAEVSRVQTLAEGKSATYTEQPTPPYYKGDTYIKEVTDSETGITMNLIYVCQYTRLEGTYHEEDFAIQPGYATLSQLTLTDRSLTYYAGEQTKDHKKLVEVEDSVDELTRKIQDIANITITDSTEVGTLTMRGINTSEPLDITIIPKVDDISYTYPSGLLFPSDTTYLKVRILDFHNTTDDTHVYYEIPNDLLYYDSETYDEYKLHYGGSTVGDLRYCEIIHRVGINNNGEKYALENETVESLEYPTIELTDGDYTITLLGYTRAYMKFTLMGANLYTTQFATRVEMNSEIAQSASSILSTVSETYETISNATTNYSQIDQRATSIETTVSTKVGNNEIISRINQTPESVTINANKINISGTITAINNDTTTTISGNKITTGSIDTAQLKANAITSDKIATNAITANKISAGTITADKIANATITGSKLVNGTITGTQIASATITNTNIVNSTITGAKIANATITDANIANINASKINAGTMSADRIYGGTINGNNVSVTNLNASNITAGTLNVGRIPNLSADKITSGTMSANRITGGTLQGSTIKASSGKIGCWNISSTNIHSSYVRFDNQNCVYIGSSSSLNSSWYNIVVAGRNASDIRLKKKIKQLELNYDKFYDELKPVEFYYKEKAHSGNKKHLGFIAQDIEKSLKENNISDMAMIWEDSGYYNLDKRELIALNVWQIQMLKKRVKELEEKLNGKTVNN